MKLITGLQVCGVLFLFLSAAWPVPPTMNYQGVLKDPVTGNPKPPGRYSMVFRVWDSETSSSSGNMKWEESQSVAVDAHGLFAAELGTVNPFSVSVLNAGEAWIDVAVDGHLMPPRRRLTSAPFALRAGDADSLEGHPASDFVLKNSLRLIVSVTDFGAKGNGTTDDAPAIRNALASLTTSGGTLRFPPGRYLVGSTVAVVQNNVSLIGDNRDACVLIPSNNSVTPLRIRANGARLSGLGFEGITGSLSAAGIEVAAGSDGLIWDCRTYRFAYGLLIHGDTSSSPTVAAERWEAARCNWSESEVAGVFLHHCSGVRISETWIDLAATGNIYGLLMESGTADVTAARINITGGSPVMVRDLMSPSAKPHNISLSQVLADSSYVFGMQFESAEHVTLTDCWAAGCKTGPGIVIGNQVSDMSLAVCRIFGNWNEGIRVVSGNPNCFLKVEDCYVGSNSQVSGNQWDGIVVEPNVSYFLFDGNGCYNGAAGQSSTQPQRYGISIGAGCDNFIVSSNLCKPNTTGGINNQSGTGATRIVTGNLQ
ncbi:MAG: glycosyl hydrolase family 28-related protein [bacterium]|nr:glycosyl hydrolase family 28-related protein [Candidatus Sumerlaeota bacterium]